MPLLRQLKKLKLMLSLLLIQFNQQYLQIVLSVLGKSCQVNTVAHICTIFRLFEMIPGIKHHTCRAAPKHWFKSSLYTSTEYRRITVCQAVNIYSLKITILWWKLMNGSMTLFSYSQLISVCSSDALCSGYILVKSAKLLLNHTLVQPPLLLLLLQCFHITEDEHRY